MSITYGFLNKKGDIINLSNHICFTSLRGRSVDRFKDPGYIVLKIHDLPFTRRYIKYLSSKYVYESHVFKRMVDDEYVTFVAVDMSLPASYMMVILGLYRYAAERFYPAAFFSYYSQLIGGGFSRPQLRDYLLVLSTRCGGTINTGGQDSMSTPAEVREYIPSEHCPFPRRITLAGIEEFVSGRYIQKTTGEKSLLDGGNWFVHRLFQTKSFDKSPMIYTIFTHTQPYIVLENFKRLIDEWKK